MRYSRWPIITLLGEMTDDDKRMNTIHFGGRHPDPH